jgi:hypothetical protein
MGFSFEWQKICMQMAEGPSNHYHLQFGGGAFKCKGKKPWSTLSKKWIKLYNAIGNCSVKLEAVGLTRIRAHTRESQGWAQFVPI